MKVASSNLAAPIPRPCNANPKAPAPMLDFGSNRNVSPLLTQQEANRKPIRAAIIGTVLAIAGCPFIFRWAYSAPAPDWPSFAAGSALLMAGGVFLGAAGLNKLGIHWWQDVTEKDEPVRPI